MLPHHRCLNPNHKAHELIKNSFASRASSDKAGQDAPRAFFLDLLLYVAVMFGVREVYFSDLGFLANGLMWSTTTLIFASWRMHARGVSWQDLGLCVPKDLKLALAATALIPAFAIGSIIVFQLLKDQLFPGLAPDNSNAEAGGKFGELAGNWALFFSIIPLIWLQSTLEELLDRGFLIHWIEKTLSSTWFATAVAVVAQAVIFGFRHSYDLSERSITVGLIGLAMGLGYVLFGRNLWPLIIAHCALNTISMVGRV